MVGSAINRALLKKGYGNKSTGGDIYIPSRKELDFSNFDNGYSILPTGQSGLFRSQHYDDQTEMYNAGEFKPFRFSYDAINDTKSSKLIFKSK